MLSHLVPVYIVAIMSFGAAILYALSMLEKSVWSLTANPDSPSVMGDDVRFIHAAPQRLVPHLRPTMGVIILTGTIAMVWQDFAHGWETVSIAVIGLLWFVFSIMLNPVGRIAVGSVFNFRAYNLNGGISTVSKQVGNPAVKHHYGLVGTLGTAVIPIEMVVV